MDSHVGQDKLVLVHDILNEEDNQMVDTLLHVDILKDSNLHVDTLLEEEDMLVVVGRLLGDSLLEVDILLLDRIHMEEDSGVLLDSLIYVKTDLSHLTHDHFCLYHCSC